MNKVLVNKFLLLSNDFLSLFLSFFIALFGLKLLSNVSSYIPLEELNNYINIHFFISFICVIYFNIQLRHYTYRKPFWFELKEILRTLMIFFIIELSVITLSKLYFSRTLWILTWCIIFILMPITRILVKNILIKIGWDQKDTIIIGSGSNAKEVYRALISEKYLGFNPRYFVSSNIQKENDIDEISIFDSQSYCLVKLSDLDKHNTQFILALDNEDVLSFWLRYLGKHKYRSVSVIPNIRGIPLYGTDMSFLFSHEMLLLRINNNLAKRSSRILKRMMDIFGSIIIIILLSPIILTLYFLIKKDGGNVIYGHSRIGRNGKEFKCLKFRSMVVNSQEVLAHLLETDPEAKAEWDKDFKLRNDPRITKVGAFIRKTSLDELPQLFNVLKGEMSLVGPRPIIKDELERYEDDVDYYLMAKPGMTGLWQVSGRNDVDYDTRVYFDAWYVKNWSLWNDIAILFKTINVVLKRDGAY
ncbi:undecaprenyl-phosphate galactose phosphotransferase WbaP [Actinobacillus pleuropneumoniae]|uniref:undecaprenyl-phosphate galactose phosphotransferase WbaP n=1 Tax=Actinobacillus pleuropneumoniae TaxID=715 RepID=UPI003F7C008B